MKITKAVITAAGRGLRLFPAADTVQKAMLPIVDRDGVAKPLIQIIAEEALESGVEEICVICAPGDEEHYRRQFQALLDNLRHAFKGVEWAHQEASRLEDLLARLHFRVQENAHGYGHAVYCARDFVGRAPFLLLLSDHLYLSHIPGMRCAQQLLELASREECSVAAVNQTRESLIGNYGTLTGRRVPGPGHQGVYQIDKILEKPSVSRAELELSTLGLRAGFYLCFFGMHILTPHIFQILEKQYSEPEGKLPDLPLTPALLELARVQKYLAIEVKGARYDIGSPFGLLKAQLALGLSGRDRDEVLSTMVETLAEMKPANAETSVTNPSGKVS